ncbi:MAG: glycosyltransferase [Bacteroidetes bacterium]|nr:glycosyltransferase [Bacteroidota bacterium]MDA1122237.1 glycosyltransferase [Bacteroidota bacterium]
MPKYSIIVPVYNRPNEIRELLKNLKTSTFSDFEVIVVDDGSTEDAESVVLPLGDSLNLKYFVKENSGPGLTRNFGAEKAEGEIIVFVDSDCLIPSNYLEEVEKVSDYDAFGGPDKAHSSFSPIQKAINFAMTSFLSTGGIRGGKKSLEAFKPRSFNMGVRKEVFVQLEGFLEMRFGEDIDFSLRLIEGGFKSILIPKAFVYHKRRSTLGQFFKQVYNSGMARINLNELHPGSMKLVHFLPVCFLIFILASFVAAPIYGQIYFAPLAIYFLLILITSTLQSVNPWVGLLSMPAVFIQIVGYGLGFLSGFCQVKVLKRPLSFGFGKSFYR